MEIGSQPIGWENTGHRGIVHRDFIDRLNIGCESFSGAFETQLRWVRDIQGQLVQGSNQLSNAVDSKLIQNDQRSETQERMIKGICTEMQELIGDREESARKHPNPEKITSVDQKLEGIDKAIEMKQIEVLTPSYKTSTRWCMVKLRSGKLFRKNLVRAKARQAVLHV